MSGQRPEDEYYVYEEPGQPAPMPLDPPRGAPTYDDLPWYKRWWVWVAAIFVVLFFALLLGGGNAVRGVIGGDSKPSPTTSQAPAQDEASPAAS